MQWTFSHAFCFEDSSDDIDIDDPFNSDDNDVKTCFLSA